MEQMSDSPHKDESPLDLGLGDFGCLHYRRRCKIRAPCCDEIFDCRLCHNETMNSIHVNPLHWHDVPRHELKTVICSLCGTEQDVQQDCIQCGVCMGKYFCSKCNLFDDDVSKQQFHCDECGICRTGGEENFVHCNRCGCCYSKFMASHNCTEQALHHNCPICSVFLFDTMNDITGLPCGHTIHKECAKEMESRFLYTCPVCSKSFLDMASVWEKLDQEVASITMPWNKKVWIFCNDCRKTSEVIFHVVALKCLNCNSFNTKQTRGEIPASCSSRIEEIMRSMAYD